MGAYTNNIDKRNGPPKSYLLGPLLEHRKISQDINYILKITPQSCNIVALWHCHFSLFDIKIVLVNCPGFSTTINNSFQYSTKKPFKILYFPIVSTSSDFSTMNNSHLPILFLSNQKHNFTQRCTRYYFFVASLWGIKLHDIVL